ncbi:MAG: ribonuclease Y [Kiritimatiellae bacterium]|nr:ribonuclease Y [Kiritimatiellia bacterium]
MEWLAIPALLLGAGAGYVVRLWLARYRTDTTESRAKALLEEAKREAAVIRKEAGIQAKAEVLHAREEFDKSMESRRREMAELEERFAQREVNLDRKVAMLDKKEHALDEKTEELSKQRETLDTLREEAERLVAEEREKLQQVAGMTQEQARQTLLERMEKDVRADAGAMIRRRIEEAKETAEREAKNIVTFAIQRYAAGHTGELMTNTVALPDEEMKGRIIGREGRNIRALEAATGINLLIDDTPEAVVISGFDPIRREVARLALERLIADGRIHPGRIEEVVEKVRQELDETIRTTGEEAVFSLGLQSVNPELVRMLGRLRFRYSYSQNVLQHSLEVANLMSGMAAELELDTTLARRIGLFHDIGKALDHEVEGGHAIIGADLLKRHGEAQVLLNAVAAHHEEVGSESLYATLCAAADAISGARLGARSESTTAYFKRIEKLEEIANSFEGIEKSYAIQAGREVRVMVQPDKVDDNEAAVLARNISKKVETELQYPGQIRVIVIRETRSVEYAK